MQEGNCNYCMPPPAAGTHWRIHESADAPMRTDIRVLSSCGSRVRTNVHTRVRAHERSALIFFNGVCHMQSPCIRSVYRSLALSLVPGHVSLSSNIELVAHLQARIQTIMVVFMRTGICAFCFVDWHGHCSIICMRGVRLGVQACTHRRTHAREFFIIFVNGAGAAKEFQKIL